MKELLTVLTATEERGAPYAEEKEETKNERKEAVAAARR
jgi:hypothetical protein